MKLNEIKYYKSACHFVEHEVGANHCMYVCALSEMPSVGISFFKSFRDLNLQESTFEEYEQAYKEVIDRITNKETRG